MSSRLDPRTHAFDDQTRHAGFLYVLMLVIAVAFGGFVWQLYSMPAAPPRITSPAPPPRTAPPLEAPAEIEAAPPESTESESAAAELEGSADTHPVEEEAPMSVGAPQLAPTPRFVANGPYVAQLAALQSDAAVDQAWRRLSSRAPQLFAAAHLDVERADLGARGVFYRVRAGYFPDRANASRFCERLRQMGQDCIVAAR